MLLVLIWTTHTHIRTCARIDTYTRSSNRPKLDITQLNPPVSAQNLPLHLQMKDSRALKCRLVYQCHFFFSLTTVHRLYIRGAHVITHYESAVCSLNATSSETFHFLITSRMFLWRFSLMNWSKRFRNQSNDRLVHGVSQVFWMNMWHIWMRTTHLIWN